MPIFAALGAKYTVFDLSSEQIKSELSVAVRESYEINALQGDMTKAFPFADEVFDVIFHPVSNCYVEDVEHIFKEAYRVLKKGGVLLSGLNNEINYIVDGNEERIVWSMPFNPLKDEKTMILWFRKNRECNFLII
jgi:methyltransferase